MLTQAIFGLSVFAAVFTVIGSVCTNEDPYFLEGAPLEFRCPYDRTQIMFVRAEVNPSDVLVLGQCQQGYCVAIDTAAFRTNMSIDGNDTVLFIFAPDRNIRNIYCVVDDVVDDSENCRPRFYKEPSLIGCSGPDYTADSEVEYSCEYDVYPTAVCSYEIETTGDSSGLNGLTMDQTYTKNPDNGDLNITCSLSFSVDGSVPGAYDLQIILNYTMGALVNNVGNLTVDPPPTTAPPTTAAPATVSPTTPADNGDQSNDDNHDDHEHHSCEHDDHAGDHVHHNNHGAVNPGYYPGMGYGPYPGVGYGPYPGLGYGPWAYPNPRFGGMVYGGYPAIMPMGWYPYRGWFPWVA